MNPKLANAIRAELLARGMTQTALAEALGVSLNTVSRWVNGRTLPDRESQYEISQVFGWSQEKLLTLFTEEQTQHVNTYRVENTEYVERQLGGDFTRFVGRILEIDKQVLPGLGEQHIGTTQQWIPIFRECPYTWRILTKDSSICGYWQFLSLKDAYHERVARGEMVDSKIDVSMLDYPIAPGRYNLYWIGFVILPTARTPTTFAMMQQSMVDAVKNFCAHEIFFADWCAAAFSFEMVRFCELTGMTANGRHPCAGGHEPAEMFTLTGADVSTGYLGRYKEIANAYDREFN